MLLLLYLDTFHNVVKLEFHYLFLLIFYHMMHIYIGHHLQHLIHVLSIVINKTWEIIVYFTVYFAYIFMYICVATHTCTFWLELWMAAFAYITAHSAWFQHLSCIVFQWGVFVHIKFHCKQCNKRLSENCIVTLVTYDVLFRIFCHLIHNFIFSLFCLVKS